MGHGQRRRCRVRRGSWPLPGAPGPGECTKSGEQQIEEAKESRAPATAPGQKGHGSATAALKLLACRLSSPLTRHAAASQPQCPGPGSPGSGVEPRRQQEPRTSDPIPAARGSAVLTFLPPRKSLRRIPLRPLQSPPSPHGTIDVSAPKVHFQALGESPIKVPGRVWDSETWHCGAAAGERRHLPQVRAFAFSRSPGFRRMPLCFVSSPVLN